jgi:selenocysteine lyase/cysteine desulfurase
MTAPGATDLMAGPLAEYAAHFVEPAGYADFARYGPPSRDVVERTARAQGDLAAGRVSVDELSPVEGRARELAARATMRASADQVALASNTSSALYQLAYSLPPGELIVSPNEFPANVYPWARAADLLTGVTVRWLDTPDGRVTPEAVAAAIGPRTVGLAVSGVDSRTGFRADLPGLRQVLGDRLLLVDAIQAFGVTDLDWSLADAVAVGGQKWLRAGWSTGFLSLSDRALSVLGHGLTGWSGVEGPTRYDGRLHEPLPSARRFTVTMPDLVAVTALEAALELVELGTIEAIARRVDRVVSELLAVIEDCGGQPIVPLAPADRAGILAFTVPYADPAAVGSALAARGIVTTIRDEYVRLSPHATTPETVADDVRETLTALRRSRSQEGQTGGS